MSTNLRKAQKHMHRARELLNQEGQLGFGGPNDNIPSKKQRVEKEDVPEGPDHWSKLPHELHEKIFKKAFSKSPCQAVCNHAAINFSYMPECKKCNKHAELARNNQIQLKSIPAKDLDKILVEEHNEDLQRQNNFLDVTENSKLLPLMQDVDITVLINTMSRHKWGYRLYCSLVKDENKHFTVIRQKVTERVKEEFYVDVYKVHEAGEYFQFNLHRRIKLFCHAYLKLKDIQNLGQIRCI